MIRDTRAAGPMRRTSFVDVAYDAVGIVAAALAVPAIPYLIWKGHGAGISERLGRVPETVRSLASPVWLHAASVGETLAAAPLASLLRARRPGVPLLATTTTVSGREVARKELAPDGVMLLPVDALRIVDRVFCKIAPRCLLIVETEIWPGLIRAAFTARVPVAILSGTLSARSFRRWRRLRSLARATLERVTRFGMQTTEDAERIIALGAPADRVVVTGTLKASRLLVAGGPPPIKGLEGRPVLIAASTQAGEEAFVLDACTGFWSQHPDLLVVIAPRRPERFAEVEKLIKERGLPCQRRSRIENSAAAQTRVLLLDTVGELMHFLPLARGVFVGGTIAPLGGHNVLEPAAFGRPVAFGPSLDNVGDAATALQAAGGGVLVRTAEDLARHWWRLLACPDVTADMGARARAVAEEGSAALEKTWVLIEAFL